MYVTSKLWKLVKANLSGIAAMTWWTLLPVIFNAVHLMCWYLLLLTLMSDGSMEWIAVCAAFVLCTCLAQCGTEHILSTQKSKYGNRFTTDFRKELFEKLFYLGPGFIDQKQSGELIITLWQKIDWICFYLFLYIPASWMIVIFSVLCALVWVPIQPVIGIIVLLGGFLVVAAPPIFHRFLKTSGENEWAEDDEFYSTCLDGLQGITTLKAFNANALHRQKVEEQFERNRKAIMSNLVFTTLNSRTIELLISACEIAADATGIWAAMSGLIETQHLVMLFMLMRAWAYGARHIFGAWLRGNKGIAAFESAWEILNEECAYSLTNIGDRKPKSAPLIEFRGDIEFEHVTFTYTDMEHPSIRDVSFSVKNGTQIALVGSSGSGKSTIARLLLGFYKPQYGTIKVGGRTLDAENVNVIQQMITAIWQDCHIFHMSCFDNIKMWLKMTSTNLGENKVEWSLTVDGQPVSLSAGIKGSLDNEGGSVKFLQAGTNVLTASVTDSLGRSFTYEQTIKVYPVLRLTLTADAATHTDEQISVSLSKDTDLPVTWKVSPSNDPNTATAYTGGLSENGGTIQITSAGTYDIAASVTDATGRVFAAPAVSVVVYPVAGLNFSLPAVA